MTSRFENKPFGVSSGKVPRAEIAAPGGREPNRPGGDRGERDAAYFRLLEQSGIRLNPAQAAAVRCTDGPLLTLAGAGSGKTSTLVCRTGYLLDVCGVDPSGILLLTFSSKAAAEMRERIAGLPGIDAYAAGRIQARTFHSFCLWLLFSQGMQKEIFGDTRRQHIQLQQLMRELSLQDAYPPENLLALLSSYKVNLMTADDLPDKSDTDRQMKRILLRYEAWKEETGRIDFDDVLTGAHALLKQRPELLDRLRRRFTHLMIDEFQDTNLLQYEVVKMIAAPRNNLMVVGDDDQTIYSFNGARSEFILEFEKLYPRARIVTLDINYRSVPSIVGLGNEVIRHNKMRRSKTLRAANGGALLPAYMRPESADDEATAIVDHINREVAAGRRNYGDFAVLYRSSSSNRAVLEQLVIRDIPHIDYGDGRLLYEHWLVKPVLDHMRLSINRRDFDAMPSVLPTLYIARDKGMAHIRQTDEARPKKGPLVHLLTLPGLKEFQLDKIRQRLEVIRSLKGLVPAAAVTQIRQSFYDAYIQAGEHSEQTSHREMLKEMLDELETSAGRFDSIVSFLAFVDDMLLRNQQTAAVKSQAQGNRVALMTIHKSKGLEFPAVFLIGASEGTLPHASALGADSLRDTRVGLEGEASYAEALEEERRLAYVAVTRAKEQLFVSSPAVQRGKKAAVSRFLLSAFGQETAASDAAVRAEYGGRRGGAPDPGRFGKVRADRFGRSGASSAAEAPVRTQSVPAWLCTSGSCVAWTRIMHSKDMNAAHKPCPLCGSPMRKGRKDVPV
ncbi:MULTISPECIES: UvrD-helicase domain-containing protein [Saccharibacillus]|uniref:UvrD-helicase domain-containing protein n=1 Tax=Saccharibacillus TaxID=456492 RepID=UPI00123ABAF8|nr:UvrD-helicase domain-containing protein [Saccharibacillus sp. WB 17]MWJ31975.1 AAA family ATPase [Saccharibacillus sp. WB 17]